MVEERVKTIQRQFLYALALYEHNVHKDLIISDCYGEHSEGYLEDKLNELCKYGLFYVYGKLDLTNRERLLEAIERRYGDESRRHV